MQVAIRALVVEDSPDDAELLVLALCRAGYRPLCERVDTAEALRAALKKPWDLVIADFNMPQFSGAAALRIVRESARDTPFILVSGTVSDEQAIDVMRAGANDYLSKDKLARLGPAVERELRDAETRRARRRAEAVLRFLADASAALAQSLEYEPTLAQVASLAVPFFADACAVDLWEEERLVGVGCAHSDPAKTAVLRAHDGDSPLTGIAARTGAPLLLVDIASPGGVSPLGPETIGKLSELGIASFISVPLTIAGQTVGAMGFGSSKRRYDASDLVLAQDLARRCSLAIHSARLFRTASDAVRKRDEFLAIAAHELRTPLTPLRLQIQSIERLLEAEKDSPLAERLRPRVQTAGRQMQRLALLVESLLDISRVMRDRLDLQTGTVELGSLVREVTERLAPDAARRGSLLSLEHADEITGVWDGAKLDQVISNLLANAIRYGAGKPIQVRVEDAGDAARIRVRDHGIGISRADRARIFERFERAVSGRHFGGLGIGLWIARRIVEAHGGWIDVESQPERGSVFTVCLPKRRGAQDPCAVAFAKASDIPGP